MKKKILAAATMAAMSTLFMGWGAVQAADTTQLPEVIVNGNRPKDETVMAGGKTDRQIHFGLYGNTDYMEVPANIASYTEKTIKQNTIPTRTF